MTDKVAVEIYADGEDKAAIEASLASYCSYLAGQVLATDIKLASIDEAKEGAVDVEWNDGSIKIKVTR